MPELSSCSPAMVVGVVVVALVIIVLMFAFQRPATMYPMSASLKPSGGSGLMRYRKPEFYSGGNPTFNQTFNCDKTYAKEADAMVACKNNARCAHVEKMSDTDYRTCVFNKSPVCFK